MRLRDAALGAGLVVLLAPAVVLTLLRLTEPASPARAVQAVAFTPVALPLYAAARVLLAVKMVVRRTVAVGYSVPAGLAEMEESGLRELLPYREGNPGADGTVTGTMVFSTQPTVLLDVLDTPMGALAVETGGLTLIGVHPSTPMAPSMWRYDHAAILEAVEERDPDFVVGDFNATADHQPMLDLDAGVVTESETTELDGSDHKPVVAVVARR